VTASPPATPQRRYRIVLALIAGALLMFGTLHLYEKFTPVEAQTVTAKAVITDLEGKSPATSFANGALVSLSSQTALVANGEQAVRWEIDPPHLAGAILRSPRFSNRDLLFVAPPLGNWTVTIRQYVTYKNAIDMTSLTFNVGAGGPNPPAPVDPKPGPKPVDPKPGPTPAPSGEIDVAIRKAAAVYFSGPGDGYAMAASMIAAAEPDFNEVMSPIKTNQGQAKETLAVAIDNVLTPLYDPATLKFKDKAVAIATFNKVSTSLRAGLRDVAR